VRSGFRVLRVLSRNTKINFETGIDSLKKEQAIPGCQDIKESLKFGWLMSWFPRQIETFDVR
jgi:hypothetical protein